MVDHLWANKATVVNLVVTILIGRQVFLLEQYLHSNCRKDVWRPLSEDYFATICNHCVAILQAATTTTTTRPFLWSQSDHGCVIDVLSFETCLSFITNIHGRDCTLQHKT